MFDLLRDRLATTVPFAHHTGVQILEVGPGVSKVALEERDEIKNHIGSHHAGALFTLAEAASGAAMVGAFFALLQQVRPVAAESSIRYLKVAKGLITGIGKVRGDSSDLMAQLERDGRVRFPVDVTLSNEAGDEVATVIVEWHLTKIV
ncbi:PaaI family thioesterase [Altererythrobacter sp. Z27]|uniref:PaaI family thioesterase n=1 Tax=Altererythrobacter sp. Z27 TaxID=3461147 RepID=UPI004044972B